MHDASLIFLEQLFEFHYSTSMVFILCVTIHLHCSSHWWNFKACKVNSHVQNFRVKIPTNCKFKVPDLQNAGFTKVKSNQRNSMHFTKQGIHCNGMVFIAGHKTPFHWRMNVCSCWNINSSDTQLHMQTNADS